MLDRIISVAKLLVALCFVSWSISAAAQESRGEERSGADEPSYQELLELLKTAKPASPAGPRSKQIQRNLRPREGVIEFDVRTRRGRMAQIAPRLQAHTSRIPGKRGVGAPRTVRGTKSDTDVRPPQRELLLQPQAITPTPPQPRTEVLEYPWQTVYALLIRYDVGGNAYYGYCSASAVDSFLLLTAAHCIYSFDPDGDGVSSLEEGTFATSVWAWAAQTDRVPPMGAPDHPYGVARATYFRVDPRWIEGGFRGTDFGLITLDRRMGDYTGWMGIEADYEPSSVHFNGYPKEPPYVPADNLLQYPGFDENNVESFTDNLLLVNALTYGGHSGGPAWRVSGSDHFIQAVNSSSDRVGQAHLLRITADRLNTITSAATEDESDRAPTPLPNLIEYVWETNAKDLLTEAVDPGGQISVRWNGFNAGFAATGPVRFDFYLSADMDITTSDVHLGGGWLENGQNGSLSAFQADSGIHALSVPTSQPAGFYYVGWIMSTTTAESDTDDNAVVIAGKRLQVRERLQPPPRVVLKSPGGTITTQQPTFKWRPAARATHYEITGKSERHGVILTLTQSAAKFRCGAGETTCQMRFQGELSRGKYSWAVRAKNAAGFGTRSPYKAFEIVPRRNRLALQQ